MTSRRKTDKNATVMRGVRICTIHVFILFEQDFIYVHSTRIQNRKLKDGGKDNLSKAKEKSKPFLERKRSFNISSQNLYAWVQKIDYFIRNGKL